MRCFIILLIAIYGLHALPTREVMLKKWETFKITHNKQYADAKEEDARKELFLKKLQRIEEHNEKFEQGTVTHKLGINQFTDYTNEELRPYIHGLVTPSRKPKPNSLYVPPENFQVPEIKDWRQDGIIPAVKDQGICAACYAFAGNGVIESHFRLYKNTEISVSEQQIVDCDGEDFGCIGGWMDTAFDYIMKNGGINTEKDYPYRQNDGGRCTYNANSTQFTITGFFDIEEGNEQDLLLAVAEKGPVAAAIDATGDFDAYESGVYYNPSCKTTADDMTHAVVIVGFGTENGQDYWLARNSWGPRWGDYGYLKMARNRDNNCGIASVASYPTV